MSARTLMRRGSFRRQVLRSETTAFIWGLSCVVALCMAKTSVRFAGMNRAPGPRGIGPIVAREQMGVQSSGLDALTAFRSLRVNAEIWSARIIRIS